MVKNSTTSKRLKQIIDSQGLKQVDILKKAQPYCLQYDIKLTKADLSQYVSGKVEPGQEKLFILSLALDVDAAWLMGYDVPIKQKTSSQFERLLSYYNLLNNKGKEEAEKRVYELTQIGIYIETQNAEEVEQQTKKRLLNYYDHLSTKTSPSFVAEESSYGVVAAHNPHSDELGEQEKMQRDISKLKRPE